MKQLLPPETWADNEALLLDSEVVKAAKERIFGFWLYLMSDCIMFGAVFAAYIVLVSGVADGPTGNTLFSLTFVFVESVLLLASSLTFGLAMIALQHQQKTSVIGWLCGTLLLGMGFIAMELHEFMTLIDEGHGPQQSAFLSAFFTLVGLHGAHVFAGIIWIITMISQILSKGLTLDVTTRINCLSLFWHFLDLIWICVFSLVYLLGGL